VPVCPACRGQEFSTLVPPTVLDEERRLRERFVKDRLSHPVSPQQLKDLTDFFHAGKAEIALCSGCSLLLRREFEAANETYSDDSYDPKAIEAVYPQYLSAFRAKEHPYRALLPAGSHVIEIGSHYGAFLQTAAEWSWHAEGVDIGEDTTRFARSKGFTVHKKELHDCRFPPASLDAVFIWNCFEQIPDPAPTLAEAHRVLKPGGLLLIRTPNGLFYAMSHSLLASADVTSPAKELVIEAMAYNNLLGFPYLYGHRRATLNLLIERFEFRFENGVNSELITLPVPDPAAWVQQEERIINDEVRLVSRSVLADGQGKLTGTWIELWYRRV
jgi:SAM-dependent methyltransferase